MTTRVIVVERDVLAGAKASAEEFRKARTRTGTLVVNLVSSPGAGKTSLLEATIRNWAGPRHTDECDAGPYTPLRHRIAVLVGDLATDRDARRLLSAWDRLPVCHSLPNAVPSSPTTRSPLINVVQMTTGGACHLEFPLVERAFNQLTSRDLDFLFIENVGNLVCPASHDLGEHLRVSLLSVTEGDDKPGKYPKMFRTSQALVISKTDLLPHVPFSVEAAAADARLIQPDLDVLAVSALDGQGVADWCSYLERQRQRLLNSHE